MQEPFDTLALAAPSCCRTKNIDTDQIIPARFLTTTERAGSASSCSTTGAIAPTAAPIRTSC